MLDSVARIRRLGIRNLQVDDYLMMFALVWYTILSVALTSVATGGGSNLMTDDDIANLTPATHAERERGSKWVFVSEHAFILCVWSLKACMLVIYSRITYVYGLTMQLLLHCSCTDLDLHQCGLEAAKMDQLHRYLRCAWLRRYRVVAFPHLPPNHQLLGCAYAGL